MGSLGEIVTKREGEPACVTSPWFPCQDKLGNRRQEADGTLDWWPNVPKGRPSSGTLASIEKQLSSKRGQARGRAGIKAPHESRLWECVWSDVCLDGSCGEPTFCRVVCSKQVGLQVGNGLDSASNRP